MIEKINQLKQGSIISESSHYIVNKVSNSNAWLTHFESGEEVQIGMSYLKHYTDSADFYNEEVKVTKEDKKDGTLGIRSIWENIHSGQVFTVCFKKQNKLKSQKKLNTEISSLIESFSNEIDNVKNNKKGVANCAKQLIEELGARSWDGFNESVQLRGVLDAGDSYSLFLEYSDGSTVKVYGYNTCPKGFDELKLKIMNIFMVLEE